MDRSVFRKSTSQCYQHDGQSHHRYRRNSKTKGTESSRKEVILLCLCCQMGGDGQLNKREKHRNSLERASVKYCFQVDIAYLEQLGE